MTERVGGVSIYGCVLMIANAILAGDQTDLLVLKREAGETGNAHRLTSGAGLEGRAENIHLSTFEDCRWWLGFTTLFVKTVGDGSGGRFV